MTIFIRTISMIFVSALCAVLVFGAFSYTTFAQPSYTINYQGKLTDNTGLTVADGTYQIVFKLYTQSTGGAAIWTETRSGGNEVTVQNGLFSVMLGSVAALSSVNFNQPLYLGVTIEADAEMTPRKALGTVPSAFEAQKVGGVASSSFLRSDTADSASGLLTFTGGVISSASSTVSRLSFLNATGTSLYIGGDRITDFTGTNLEVTGTSLGLSSTYTGQTSITTLGTITAGTWNGTAIDASYLDTTILTASEVSDSAELAGLLSDETGYSSGALAVFSISPVITGTADFVAGDFSSTLTLSGTAANIALGSNYLSGDGDDEGIYIGSTGSVGIGTSTPIAKLGVNGTLAIGGDVSFATEGYSGVQTTFNFSGSSNSNSIFSIRNANPAYDSNYGITMQTNSADSYINSGQYGTLHIGVNNGGKPLLFQENGGNVGIGTTTPNQKLSIFANAADSAIEFSALSGASRKWTMGIDYSDAAKFKISSSSALGTNDRFVINGSGYVGIGTSSPSVPLEVGQTTSLASISGAALNVSPVWTNNSSGTMYGMRVSASSAFADSGSSRLLSLAYNNSEIFNFQRNGELALFASGTVNPKISLGSSYISTANSGQYITYHSYYDQTFESQTATIMTLKSSGNVGIGDTSPVALFTVGSGDLFQINSSGVLASSNNITPDSILSTSQVDEYCLTYETGDVFEWQACGAEDLTNNSIEELQDVATITENYGDLLFWNGSAWADIATSSLNIALSNTAGTLGVTRGGTGLVTVTTGDLLYASASDTLSRRAIGTTGQVLQVVGGLPTWVATSSLGISAGGGTFLALTDTPSSFTAYRIPFTNSGATALIDDSGFLFNGTTDTLTVGSATFATTGFSFAGAATSTIVNNNPYAFTIATSTGANPLFRIDTSSGAQSVIIGSGGSDIYIGDIGSPANLIFEESSTISGQGTNTITLGVSGDVFNVASGVKLGIASTSPWQELSINGDIALTGRIYDSVASAGTSGMVLQTTGSATRWVATSSLGFATYSGFDTSAELATLLIDETGYSSGALAVFSISPTITGTADFVAGDFSSTLTMSGSAANIALGSNFISNGGADEGISVGASGNVTISGTLGVTGGLTIDATTETNIEAAIDTLSNLTSIGTIGTGVWQGTAIGAIYGGTSFTTYATGDMIYASGVNTLSKRTIGTTGQILSVSGGVPTWTSTSTLGLSSAFSTSAELATLLIDETGYSSGALAVFSISPTITGTADFVAGDFSSTLTMSGSAANIALGSNYLSGDGDDEGIYIGSGGNVGIGTTTPAAKFEIAGNNYPYAYITDTGNTEAGIYIRRDQVGGSTYDNGWYMYMNPSSKDLSFYDDQSADDVFTIKSGSGNVGIGTTSPASLLSVAGNGYLIGGLGVGKVNTVAGTIDTTGIYKVNGTTVVYLPNQSNFVGSLFVGNGGTSLSHTSGSEGYYNVGVGSDALNVVTTGYGNTALGASTLRSHTIGIFNVAVGTNAMFSNTTGSDNSAFGKGALSANVSGSGNTALGQIALISSVTGSDNTAVGNYSLYYNGAATSSVAVGAYAARGIALYSNQGSTYMGYSAGYSAGNSSDFNTLIGYQAGYTVTTGQYNTILGYSGTSGGVTTGSNNILIGKDVRSGLVVGSSNQLNIGNLLFGTGLGSGTTYGTGNIGIGTTTPNQKLSIFNSAADSAIELSSASGSTYKWTMGIDYSDAAKFKISSSSALGTNDRFTINGSGGVTFNADYATNYAGYFFNDGNNANRYGLKVQAGADDGTGTTYYLDAYDGDGGQVGYIANTSGTFALTDVSDIRTKVNVTNTEIVNATDVISALRVVDFNRKQDPDGPRITGFIAQEVETVFPFAVTENPKTGYLGVMKDAFVPLLVKGAQEQQSLIESQGASLATLADSLTGTITSIADLEASLTKGLSDGYLSQDDTLEAGEIVALATTSARTITRATYGQSAFGVVANDEGILLGESSGVPVAQAGKVLVKVNGEGGDIKIGDAITLSSEAGVGTKATTTSRIIGVALEDENNDDFVQIAVRNELYFASETAAAFDTLFAPIDSNQDDTLWKRITTLASNFVDGVLSVTGVKTDKVEVKNELCVDGTCINGGDLRALLQEAGRTGSAPSSPELQLEPESNPTPATESETNNSEEEIGLKPVPTPDPQLEEHLAPELQPEPESNLTPTIEP